MIVQTKAVFDEETQEFVLQSPTTGSQKNWISQGYTADKAVVMADLELAGKSLGPHAFLIDFRDSAGNLTKGITANDMGKKTTGNDLDNAALAFNQVRQGG